MTGLRVLSFDMYVHAANFKFGINFAVHSFDAIFFISSAYSFNFLEYLSIGFFAGVLGSLLAVVTTFFIEEIVFEINPKIYWDVILIGALGSILVIGIIAALFTFYLTAKTPKDVLRGADA